MSRFFEGGTSAANVAFGTGDAPPDQGPITIMALVNPSVTNATARIVQGANSGGGLVLGLLCSGGKWFAENDFSSGCGAVVTGWQYVGFSKAAGSATPTFHFGIPDGVGGIDWTHTPGGGAVGDGSGPISVIRVGDGVDASATQTWRGEIATVGMWRASLADGDVEAACTLAAEDMFSAGVNWMVEFDQDDVADAVIDPTGRVGATDGSQTGRTGTSVGSTELDGYDYALAGSIPEYLYTGVTPVVNVNDGSPITLSTTFYVTEADAVCVGGEVELPNPVNGTHSLVLWECTHEDADGTPAGTELASVLLGDRSPGRNYGAFANAVALDTSKIYRLGVRSSAGSYCAVNGYFNATEHVVGPITAPQDSYFRSGLGTFWNGAYGLDATSYPTQHFNSTTYLVGPAVRIVGAVPPEDHTTAGTASASATATSAAVKRGVSAGTATAAATATAAVASTRVTSGTAAAAATATATTAGARTSAGTASAAATAHATVSKRAITAGTASATATGGTYSAQGAPGPWLTKRNRDPRIVTRVQVAN